MILEEARREKRIGSSLEGAIRLTGTGALARDLESAGLDSDALADLFIVSSVSFEDASVSPGGQPSGVFDGLRLEFAKAEGRRCDRCWKVTPEASGDGLCARCRRALASLPGPQSPGDAVGEGPRA